MKYDLGEFKMNKKILLSACALSIFGILGCTHSRSDYSTCSGPDCAASADLVCQSTDDPSLCPTDPFVNYTRGAADYRKYGERTPRDRAISQSAAGNNMVAAVPPSIEDEVVFYEAQLKQTASEDVTAEAATPAPAPTPVPTVAYIQTVAPAQTAVVPTPKPEEYSDNEEEDIEYEDEDDDLLDVEVNEEVSSEIEKSSKDDSVEDPVQDWLAEEGQNLKALLTEWSEQSGWRLVWNTNRNYVLSAGAMFRGRFADVSSALIRAFARARPAPIATFYKGNRVLVVETMEDENAYN